MKIRVSDYIANFLEKKGVKKVFLVAGGGMMHLLDSIGQAKKIGFIANHHEQASAIAAEGYARRSSGLGVCYATSGPGATNIITGVAGAWLDSSPVLFITGQSKTSQTIRHTKSWGLRQFGAFEVDILPIVKSITKYAVFLDDPNKIHYHLEKAYHLATTGRPGPVLLDIPVDVQGALIDPQNLPGYTPKRSSTVGMDARIIGSIIKNLLKAKRPLLLIGHGIRASNSVENFHALSKLLNIPIVTTQLAKDILEYSKPLFVGHPGLKGDRPGNFAIQSADCILSLGCSLHVLNTGYELDNFAPTAYKILVDIDQHVLQREEVHVNKKICCDLAVFTQAALQLLHNKYSNLLPLVKTSEWHKQCRGWKKKFAVTNEPHKKSKDAINYYEFVDVLSDVCQGGETIIADAGSSFYVIGQAFRVKPSQRVITSGALGAMGYGLPAAIGACSASSLRPVICVIGDGSIQMCIQELATIAHNCLNIKVFVLNNSGYVSIRNTQNSFFNGHLVGVDFASGVSFPDFQKIAEAYNLPYTSINKVNELKEKIAMVLVAKGPIVCEVHVVTEQEIIPTVSSQKLADGRMVSRSLDDMYPFSIKYRT